MEIKSRKIYLMDAIAFMEQCISAGVKVDLVFTDPPYGIANNTVIVRKECANIDLRFGDWDVFKDKKAFFEWTFSWVEKANLLLRPGGIFVSFFDRAKINYLADYLVDNHHYKIKNNFSWIKPNPAPQYRNVKWSPGWEAAVILQKPSGYDDKKKAYLYQGLTFNHQLGHHPDYVFAPVISGSERKDCTVYVMEEVEEGKEEVPDKNQETLVPNQESYGKKFVKKRMVHPTQKPLAVLYPFINYWTNKGDSVLDPFSGVASIPFACETLSRKWYACDNEKKWVNIGRNRMAKLAGITRLEDFT